STSHMLSDWNLFISLDETERGMINTSCGPNTLTIKEKGTISMLFSNKTVVLHEVLLVPKITVNLLSLHCLLLDQCKIKFDINTFQVLKKDEPFLSGKYHNNLPVVKLEKFFHQSKLSVAEKLHKSLGHVSYRRIRNKLGIPITLSKELHLDIIGPITPVSHKNHKYILTIVNGNTRFCSAIALACKDWGIILPLCTLIEAPSLCMPTWMPIARTTLYVVVIPKDQHTEKDIKKGKKQEYYFRFRISAQNNP
ncbi:hypothetical protein VP01_9042g1, partial [Puccinia sorghi]